MISTVTGYDSITKRTFAVSTRSGGDIDGYLLQVTRHDLPYRGGPWNFHTVVEKLFKTNEEANKWALDHGYTQRWYRRVWCRKHRLLHFFISAPCGPFPSQENCDRFQVWGPEAQAHATELNLSIKRHWEEKRHESSTMAAGKVVS